jgi:uncharacterized protein YacL (UPF0231 family)
MKRVTRSFRLGVIVALAVISPATASASEPTKILPEPTAAAPLTTASTQSAEGHLLTVGGLEVKCKKSSGSESWTSANLGTKSVLFTECKGPLLTTCTGEGDAEGLIAAKGEVHFWLALLMTGTREKPTAELVGALVFLLESAGVQFICVNKAKTIEDKIVVHGCAAWQVSPASLNKLITEAKEELAEWSSGETKILSVLPQETTKGINCLPTTTVNGGAEELSGLSGVFTTETFKKGGSSITIELMNAGGGGGGAEPTTLSTKLSGEGKEGEEITILEGAKAKDKATLSGKNASKATGKLTYAVYSEKECKTLVTTAGEVTVSGETVPASSEEGLEGGKTYYWQAHYGGDSNNDESTSPCTEILNVKAKTSLSTKLSGESKEGEELTILEGSKAKDTATLSGTNSPTAGGKVLYKIYSDKECKTLFREAGEVTVSAGSVPASSEEELEGGKTYYWQATYKGDGLHQESKSECGKEILNVKAKTSLSTKLSGESKEGEELTILEGSKAKDTATLSGTNSSTAGGKVLYKIYSDKECKTLFREAGEVTVSAGSVPASSEEELEGGKTYYWQATYKGDGLHQESQSECGKEILHVRAPTSITTSLLSEDEENEEVSEGPEITIPSNDPIADTATLSGTNVATGEGTVTYRVYSDNKCEHLVAEAGEGAVIAGVLSPSSEEVLASGTYYWQATYSGDATHAGSTSSCGSEIATVKASTSLTTSLTGEAQEGAEVSVAEGSPVKDTAILSGEAAAMATGKVKYAVYSDAECTELVTEAGEVSVAGEIVPDSDAETLPAGAYYWQATYTGDAANDATKSVCGSEITVVTPVLTTTLSGESKSGATLEILEGTALRDDATLHGPNASTATGTLTYKVYSDAECHDLVTEAGTVTVAGETAPLSEEKTLPAGEYYWQVEYSGDAEHPAATSPCGEELAQIATSTTLTTSLSGEGKSGSEIEVQEGASVHDNATLSGANSSRATGAVEYNVYSDSECKQLVALAGDESVSGGIVPSSSTLTLPPGTYYWQATYLGGGINQRSSSTCGSEILVVTAPMTTTLSSGATTGKDLVVPEESVVTDKATLHGEHASSATGTVRYKIYADSECTELVSEAGEVIVSGEHVPASDDESLSLGDYYWQAEYSGDGSNPPATTACAKSQVLVMGPNTKYAALGDSFAAGVGVTALPGWRGGRWEVEEPKYYKYAKRIGQKCLRSSWSWPGLVASAFFGLVPENETEVFQQQPTSFIFRACSGSLTETLWNGVEQNGLYDEAVFAAPVGFWVRRPSQDLWLSLPGGTRPTGVNPAIKLVTLTVGINDAGFKSVLLACLTPNNQVGWPRLGGMRHCQAQMKEAVEVKIPAVKARLETVLEDIRTRAPQASIAVPFYPMALDTGVQPLIPVGLGLAIGSRPWMIEPRPGEPIWSAAAWVEHYTRRLNEELQRAVERWNANRNIARVVPGTETAFPAGAGGNRLGDAQPWMNGLIARTNYRENFHPNCWGYQAVARRVLAGIGWAGRGPQRGC